MSPRERRLLIAFLSVLGVGAALIVGYQWFWVPFSTANRDITRLHEENEQKERELNAVIADKKLLEKARLLSLPTKLDTAVAEYSKYLQPLLRESGLEVENFQAPSAAESKTPAPAAGQARKPGHQVLAWQVRAKGELASLVKALEVLQKTPLMHRVKVLDVTRIDTSPKASSNKLNINLTIEAMVVGRSESRPDNLRGIDLRPALFDGIAALHGIPSSLSMLPWVVGPSGPVAQALLARETGARSYADIAKRNVFVGAQAPPPEVPVAKVAESEIDPVMMEYVRLETTNTDGREAFFRNRIVTPAYVRVRAIPGSGFDTFRIMNELRDKELLRGKVLRVDQRDVYFQVKDDVYAVHVGQTLAEALRRPLLDDAIKELDLTGLYDEEFAEASPAALNGKTQKKGKSKGTR